MRGVFMMISLLILLIICDDSHGVEDPEVDRDYVKDFAAPELYATFVLSEATMVKFPV